MKRKSLLTLILLILWLICSFAFASTKNVAISPQLALWLGTRIWQNESGGKFNGLVMWNQGESFASLGIGHFVWRPRGRGASINDEFPQLLRYMKKRGVFIPLWLYNINFIYCPWNTRDEFKVAYSTPEMKELQQFLAKTIPIQAEYMVYKLKIILPKFLAGVPPYERPYIAQQFSTLEHTANGLYAMVDYLNFKGSGVAFSKKYDNYGWGLLQVLEYMQFSPSKMSPVESFAWSAKMVLNRHVEQAPPAYRQQYAAWLPGWYKRIDTYTHGFPY